MHWVVIFWLIGFFLCWAIVYGGTANDDSRYEEGYYDEPKTEKEKFSDHSSEV